MFDRPIRLNGTSLQAPILQLSRADGRRVDLVGLCHIAHRDFFASVQSFADRRERDSAEIQYERTRQSYERDEDNRHLVFARGLDRGLGLRCQFYDEDSLVVRPSWVNADADALDIYRLMTGDPTVTRQQMWDRHAEESAAIRQYRPAALLRIYETDKLDFAVGQGLTKREHWHVVALTVRNLVAVRHIRAALGLGRDVVALWGAAHLRGLAGLLCNDGFHEQARVWQTFHVLRNHY